jgi:hypothetical protein
MPGAVTLFVDCQNCEPEYFDFFKSAIGFVNFVRDRHLADVHVLISRQETGSSGREWLLEFIGLDRFPGMTDTLKFISPPNETDDAIRKGLVKTITMGLMRFVNRTPQAKDLQINYTRPTSQAQTRDRWNYWVFNINLDGYTSGQATYKYFSLYTDVSANRVTEGLKIKLDFWTNYSQRKYPEDMYLSRSLGFNAAVAPSITAHWSLGATLDCYANTYSNVRGSYSLGPAVEYDIFPYKESSRRMLRISYGVYVKYVDYVEKTIYEKENEVLSKHWLEFDVDLTQPWGQVSTSVSWSNYLRDFGKNRISLSGTVSFNLVSGLQLTSNGGYSRIHDQIALPAGGATQEQQLLQLREQATSYDYWVSFGFKYTFGSKYNNVVNRRFGW